MGIRSRNLPHTTDPTVLRFDRIGVHFEEKQAVSGVSFSAAPGETVVLFGASGSGKTVLLKSAIGLIPASAGRVWLFGEDIAGLSEEQLFPLRRRVGVLFQEGGLFDSLTVEENVAYPLLSQGRTEPPESEIRKRVQDALDFVELGTSGSQFPVELSGGMRRRVGIARAVVADPALVLYDSPTAGLDPITAYRIMTLIVRQRDKSSATSVIVTQRYQDGALLADYRYDFLTGQLRLAEEDRPHTTFLVLREGRKIFEGTQEELRRSHDPYIARFGGKREPPMESGPCAPGSEVVDHFLQVR